MAEHVLGVVDDRLDVGDVHPPAGDLDGGLDHRQREALDAEAVAPDIAALGLQKPGLEMVAAGIIRQQFREMVVGQAEEALVVPERIVGVEGDGGKGRHRRSRTAIRRGDLRAGPRRDQ